MKHRKICLVVGASSGIGKAAAEALAGLGHRVYGTSRDASRVTTANVVGLDLEINDDHSIREAVDKILEAEKRIDAMFYAAGFYTAGAIEETTPEQIHQQLDAYFVGAHRVTRALLPHFREAGAGRLLYMSSNAGDAARQPVLVDEANTHHVGRGRWIVMVVELVVGGWSLGGRDLDPPYPMFRH